MSIRTQSIENRSRSDTVLCMSGDNLSDFLRTPKKILKQVDKGDVVLARRGKASIRISLESRKEAERGGNELAANLLADAVESTPEVRPRLPAILEHRFPWVRFLPPEDKQMFAQELVELLQAAAAVGRLARLDDLFRSWKATATVYADPDLAATLKGPIKETDIRVRRP